MSLVKNVSKVMSHDWTMFVQPFFAKIVPFRKREACVFYTVQFRRNFETSAFVSMVRCPETREPAAYMVLFFWPRNVRLAKF